MSSAMKFRHPHESTTEEAIQNFEKQQGYTLPEEYRQFLLKYNGGRSPKRSYFDYQLPNGEQLSDTIGIWLGLNVDENYDLRHSQDVQNQPDYLLNIGDAFFRLIGIGISGHTIGKTDIQRVLSSKV